MKPEPSTGNADEPKVLYQHVAVYAVSRGLPALLNFLVIFVFSRLLTPDQYGEYTLTVTGATFVSTALFHWLKLTLVRFSTGQEAHDPGLWSNLLVGIVVSIAICLALGGASVYFLQPSTTLPLLLVVPLLAITQGITEIALGWASSQLKPQLYGRLSLLRSFTSLAVGVLFVSIGWGPFGAVLGSMLGYLLPAGWLLARVGRLFSVRAVRCERLRQVAAYGLPMSLTLVLSYIVFLSDRYIIAAMSSLEDAGLYSAGYDLTRQTMGTLLMVINLAAYPIAIRAFERGDKEAARDQLSRNATLLMGIGIPALLAFMALGENISSVVLGEQFRRAAATIIPIIALGVFLDGVRSYYFDQSFHLSKKTALQTYILLGAAALNVLLDLILIPRHGLLGASWATVIAYLFAAVCSLVLGRRAFTMPLPAKNLAGITAASVIMACVLLLLRDLVGFSGLVVQVAIGLSVYLLGIIVMDVAGSRRFMLRRLDDLKR